MGLPRELINEIMRYNDLQTLKKCSLTSRDFYSAARPLIHDRIMLGWSSTMHNFDRCLEVPYPDWDTYPQQADVFHARYLSAAEERGLLRYGYIREVTLELSQLAHPENVLQLRQLRALETVHTLTIETLALSQVLPIFDSCFSQFVPTLRSLTLRRISCKDVHQLLEFICRFPHLDDLTFAESYGPSVANPPPGSEGPRPQQPLPFRGHLELEGGIDNLMRCLVVLPGGLRFRSIAVVGSQTPGDDLARLLVACSPTLEVLTIQCFEIRESGT